MKRIRAVESDSVKSARKAKDKLHKACERASEIFEQILHTQVYLRHGWKTKVVFHNFLSA